MSVFSLRAISTLIVSSFPIVLSAPRFSGTGNLEALSERIHFNGEEVINSIDCTASATLFMAYAEFVIKVIKVLASDKSLIAPGYVYLNIDESFSEFAIRLTPNRCGSLTVSKVLPLWKWTTRDSF